jgi:anti-sigma regulatory factor (Ser/Thr protein kinase)
VKVVPSWSHALSSRPDAATEARHLVSELAPKLIPDQIRDDVVLLTSELVANALRHGAPAASVDQGITLMITAEGSVLRVAVGDSGPGFDPSRLRPSATGGWGLLLVDRLASRWGLDRKNDCTEVWFEIDVPSG